MNYLLDTHTLLWSLFDPNKLAKNTQIVLKTNVESCYVSSIVFFEISLKFGLGKLEMNGLNPVDIYKETVRLKYNILELSTFDILDFYKLPQNLHKDPFDKIIAWQAIKHNYTLLSVDSKLEVYKQNSLKILT